MGLGFPVFGNSHLYCADPYVNPFFPGKWRWAIDTLPRHVRLVCNALGVTSETMVTEATEPDGFVWFCLIAEQQWTALLLSSLFSYGQTVRELALHRSWQFSIIVRWKEHLQDNSIFEGKNHCVPWCFPWTNPLNLCFTLFQELATAKYLDPSQTGRYLYLPK